MMDSTHSPNKLISKQRRNFLLVILVAVVVVIVLATITPMSHPKIATRPKHGKGQFGRTSGSTMTHPVTVVETRDNETNAKRSSFSVLSQNISVGRPIHILLTTRDRKGNRRTRGDDFFTAVLRSDRTSSISFSSSGQVEDLSNGSYLITFLPLWSGRAIVQIRLWVTSRVKRILRGNVPPNYDHLCTFGHKSSFQVNFISRTETRDKLLPKLKADLEANKRDSVGLCHMDCQPILPRSNASCSMSFPGNHNWYGMCQAPRARNSTTCDSLQFCVLDESAPARNGRECAIGRVNIGVVPAGADPLIISKSDDNGEGTSSKEPCQPKPYVRARGYWWGREWINSDCSFQCTSKEKWWKCLRGRNLTFIGASTVRQLYGLLVSGVGTPTLVPKNFANTYVSKHNASIRYITHGPPVRAAMAINFSSAIFAADVIDSIPGNGNQILVMSTIHHFIMLSPEGFQQRLQEIIAAIRRLRQRSVGKKIPILFRTANPRNFDSFLINAYRIKWYNELAVEAFVTSELGVIVYDVFDMLDSGPEPESVHQKDYVMSVQLSHIFSLIGCV